MVRYRNTRLRTTFHLPGVPAARRGAAAGPFGLTQLRADLQGRSGNQACLSLGRRVRQTLRGRSHELPERRGQTPQTYTQARARGVIPRFPRHAAHLSFSVLCMRRLLDY